jgi:hypothetical protein
MGRVQLHLSKAEGTKARRVWEIADELAGDAGTPPGQPSVVARFKAEGGNANTAKTEYVNWRRAYERQAAGGAVPEEVPLWRRDPGNVSLQRLTVARDGRLLIPAAMREAMLLGPDGVVTACVVDGELRIIAPYAAIRQLQEEASRLVPPGVSLVDELIAERRAETRREEEG